MAISEQQKTLQGSWTLVRLRHIMTFAHFVAHLLRCHFVVFAPMCFATGVLRLILIIK